MKVLHVSTFGESGGAARAMLRWHRRLLLDGFESRVLCFESKKNEATISVLSKPRDSTESAKAWVSQRKWIDQSRTSFSDNFFSQAFFDCRISGEEWVEWADVIHIHWISRFLNLEDLAQIRLRGKPIVATPHDLWFFTGGCHYPSSCRQYGELCMECPMVVPESRRFVEINHRFKKDILSNVVSAWIGPSSWMREQILRCRDFPAADVFVVPYACDFESFWPGNKAEDRKRLDLPVDHKLILFVAENLGESRKGFGDFEQVLLRLHNLAADQRGTAPIGALLAGRAEGVEKGKLRFPVFELGYIDDPATLRAAYSAADILLYTGIEDNLPNVVTEALACGTPVIGYRTGGIVDQVRPGENGILVATGNVEAATNALAELLQNPARIRELASRARESVEMSFDNQRIVRKLIFIYEKVVSDPAPKVPLPSLKREWAEYEAFAGRALADLLERSGELEGEVKWLRNQSLEYGSVCELLRIWAAEIDEMFSFAPARVQNQYAQIAKGITEEGTTGIRRSLEEQWRKTNIKIYLLKEFLGWRPEKR